MSIEFVISSHPRLAFKDARASVHAFVADRLRAHGFDRVRFCDSKQDAPAHIRAAAGAAQASDWIVWLDAMNPMPDCSLITTMIERLSRSERDAAIAEGAVPGTQPELVVRATAARSFEPSLAASPSVLRVRWPSQAHHNNQFNLYKYKRLRTFLGLTKMLPDMASLSVDAFCAKLAEPTVYEAILSYFDNGPLMTYTACPSCAAPLDPLTPRMSQPVIGYLPAARAAYHECQLCGLIVLSPCLKPDDVHLLYDEFDREDFAASANNPYQDGAVRCDLRHVVDDLPTDAATLDLGGGMGRFSQYLRNAHPSWRVTHSDFALKRNEHLEAEGIATRALNFLKEDIGHSNYDLITAWEVIEHIPFPLLAPVLERIHQALRPGGVFIFSTPDFDSPLCQSNDFFNVVPPFHYTVFSRRWLEAYFGKTKQWNVIDVRAESDFLQDAGMWYDYLRRTSPGFQLCATAQVLQTIFTSDAGPAAKQALLSAGMGTEIVMTVRRSS